MYYFHKFNRSILVSLILLGCSISSVNAALVAPGQLAVFSFDTSSLGAFAVNQFKYSTTLCTNNDGNAECLLGSGKSFDLLFGTTFGGDDIGTSSFTNSFSSIDLANVTTGVIPIQNILGSVTLLFVSLGFGDDTFDVATLELNTPDLVGQFVGISAVPIPAAIWLFGTALIGLFGFGKRKSRIAT